MIYTSLGRLIREEREEMGLTLEDVQQLTGLSLSRLSRIESNGVSADQASRILSKISPTLKLSVSRREKDAYLKINIILDAVLSLHYLTGIGSLKIYQFFCAFSALDYMASSEERLKSLTYLELCEDVIAYCRTMGADIDMSFENVEDVDLVHERQRVLLKKMGYTAMRQLPMSYQECALQIFCSKIANDVIDNVDDIVMSPPSSILYEFVKEIKMLGNMLNIN